MIKCDIKPVNATYENNFYKIGYIPFSISTIKLLINNEEDSDVDILIKPVRSQNNDDFCGGFDDYNKGLRIIWGGGQEDGVSTTIKGNDKKYAFLFVFPPNDSKLLNYNLTLMVNKTLQDSNEKLSSAEIPIKLYPIQKIEYVDDIVHQKITGDSLSNTITFDGKLVGYYYPRWFPELDSFFPDARNHYQSDPRISDFSLRTFKKSSIFDKDRIMLYFRKKEMADIEGDMDGAMFHTDVFKFNNVFIIRIWFLWISKKQFLEGENLEPLEQPTRKKGFFDFEPELPDFERFDIAVSPSDGSILAIGTDFHWQEYWYKTRRDNLHIRGIVAKLLHPVDESLSRLLSRDFIDNKYESVIDNLRKMTSLTDVIELNSGPIYMKGEEMNKTIQTKKNKPVTKGKNFFRSHVPYVRNADVLSNMISRIVDKYE